MDIAKKLKARLQQRADDNSLRALTPDSSPTSIIVDFSSNDYLGYGQSEIIFDNTHEYLIANNIKNNGATGSRLLSGNHQLYERVETQLSSVHQAAASLVFNSGYDANLGLLSSVPQRNDIILYDQLSHASIRDGMQLSHARHYSYAHNDLQQLEHKLKQFHDKVNNSDGDIYVVTESVFSMDGDSPDIEQLIMLCQKYHARLIIDEAHALGIYQLGLVQHLNLHQDVFARVITFGKALGCHGAAILGSRDLIDYLINFSRPFIYTTGLSPHSLATIIMAYEQLLNSTDQRLQENINIFKLLLGKLNMDNLFINSDSAIQSCIISGNNRVRTITKKLLANNFDVKAILSPTVALGDERLRFCLHSYNTRAQIEQVLKLLKKYLHDSVNEPIKDNNS